MLEEDVTHALRRQRASEKASALEKLRQDKQDRKREEAARCAAAEAKRAEEARAKREAAEAAIRERGEAAAAEERQRQKEQQLAQRTALEATRASRVGGGYRLWTERLHPGENPAEESS